MITAEQGRIEAIVFDFDGTLARSPLDFGEMKRRLTEMLLQILPDEEGPPSVPALEWLEAAAEEVRRRRSPSAARSFRDNAMALICGMEMEAARQGELFPYSRPVLMRLSERGVRTVIITRNCSEAVRTVFPDLDEHCAGLLSRDHVDRVKPDPGHLLRALGMVSADPLKSMMVGDHPLDVKTGKLANVATAGVWSGKATRAELVDSGADIVARDCEELVRFLQSERLID
jgi:phosphoglycolate phosphatase